VLYLQGTNYPHIVIGWCLFAYSTSDIQWLGADKLAFTYQVLYVKVSYEPKFCHVENRSKISTFQKWS